MKASDYIENKSINWSDNNVTGIWSVLYTGPVNAHFEIEFKEIATADLPTAVSEAVAKNYPTATIDNAYVNEEKQYKLEVSLEDGTSGTLYADENGNWLDF